MNGFANAILSLLLGWLRSVFNAVWVVLGSDGGGDALRFLRENWQLVFLILCVGGFVVDRVIYWIRWRPDYVWAARRERRRRMSEEAEYETAQAPRTFDAYRQYPQSFSLPEDEPPRYDDAYGATAQYIPAAYDESSEVATARYPAQNGYAPRNASTVRTHPESTFRTPDPYASDAYPFSADRASERASFTPPAQSAAPAQGRARRISQPALPQDASFAPTAFYEPVSFQTPIQPEPLTAEPRFDEDFTPWTAPQSLYADLAPERELARGMAPSFGTALPEPTQYLEDVQGSYAPRPAPAQHYTPPPQPEAASYAQIHPGLDQETFQQNIGITDPEALVDAQRRNTDPYADFTPFPVASQQEQGTAKARGLGALAKKARTFISGDDERNPRTISDLQTNVDVKNAFHAPVYPKKKPESEEE